MRIVFVGGTRFVGRFAAEAAVARGHEVIVLHRGRHRCDVGAAHDVIVDRGDPSALAQAVALARPEVVVDTRAMTRADAETVALAVKITRVPLVVLSSQDVYAAFGAILGHPAPPPEPVLTEDSPLTVPFPYRGSGHDGGEDYDKKDVERVVRKAVEGNEIAGACVLRLPAVYGPHDYRRRFGDIIDRLDERRALPCRGGASWRWTHADVRDVAHAIVLCAEHHRAGFRVYNVGEPEPPTMHARVVDFAAEMDVPVSWHETDEALEPAFRVLGRAPDIVVDSTRIRTELGYAEVTTSAERVRDLVTWCRSSRGLRLLDPP